MKRLAAVAVVLVGCFAVACGPVQAQRGGGHAGGVSGGGMRGGTPVRGSFSAPVSRGYSAGPRYASGRVAAPVGAYRGGASVARPAFYSNRGRPYGRLRGGGYGYGYPLAGGFVAPYYLGYPDTISYDAPPAPYADAQNYVDAQPPDPGFAPDYPQQQPAQEAYAQAPAPPPEAEDAVTIIYKDGRSEQIHNYALTRTTLYVTDKRRRDIPLDQIDLAATEKVNREAGVAFALPTAQ
jgi:hypothetical protein